MSKRSPHAFLPFSAGSRSEICASATLLRHRRQLVFSKCCKAIGKHFTDSGSVLPKPVKHVSHLVSECFCIAVYLRIGFANNVYFPWTAKTQPSLFHTSLCAVMELGLHTMSFVAFPQAWEQCNGNTTLIPTQKVCFKLQWRFLFSWWIIYFFCLPRCI